MAPLLHKYVNPPVPPDAVALTTAKVPQEIELLGEVFTITGGLDAIVTAVDVVQPAPEVLLTTRLYVPAFKLYMFAVF